MSGLRGFAVASRAFAVLSKTLKPGGEGNPGIGRLNETVKLKRVAFPARRFYCSELYSNESSNTDETSSQSSQSKELSEDAIDKRLSQPLTGDPYRGISLSTFSEEINKTLLGPLNTKDVEIKPDGLIYLPEIKYRRILNQAFGPGGWALMPRGEVQHFKNETEGAQLITREYALYCLGRFISQSIGEHTFYSKMNLSYGKATESSKSNGLMRCCKDLGIASELWDPQFVREWKANNASEIWCENIRTKDKKKLWRKNSSRELFPFPWKESK